MFKKCVKYLNKFFLKKERKIEQKFPIKNKFGRYDIDMICDENKNLFCPNCGSSNWISLSGGGSMGNIQCGNCSKKYNNLFIFGLEEIK